jgi:hypothetical protein
MVLGHRYPHVEKIELYLYLSSHTKINSKWIKDLNLRLEIVKLVEGNIGRKLSGIDVDNDFLAMTPTAQAKKAKVLAE